jgi:hypothetical protein
LRVGLVWSDGTRSVPTTFFDVGGEGFDGAGDGAESGEGEDDAGLLAAVFGVAAGAVEVVLEELELVLELVGGDVLGEAGFFFQLGVGFDGQGLGEPLGDAFDDLADAGLGDFVLFGEPPGGHVIDEVEAVDFEVAGGGGQERVQGSGFRVDMAVAPGQKGFQVPSDPLARVPRFQVGTAAEECMRGCGLVWSI